MSQIYEGKNIQHITRNNIALAWLESNKIKNKYKQFILNMTPAEINTYFTDEKMMFGTAGIRGILGPGTNQINMFTYQQMSEGVAKWLLTKKQKPIVVIGHDSRKNADFYANVVAKTLSSFGIRVYLYKDNQMKATPIISYTVREIEADGGINITASHNPKEYLGFKVYGDTGAQVNSEEADRIVELMPENETIIHNEYTPDYELISYLDDSITEKYFEATYKCLINTNLYQNKEFPIVLTPHHGTACYDLPFLIKSLGYKNLVMVKQQSEPDPDFKYSPSFNPEDEKSFELGLKYAKKAKAEIILAVDPDADRFAVAVKHQNRWHFLNGNEMGIIFTHYTLTNKQFTKTPFIVSTYVSTNYIDLIAKKFNANVYRTPTGFRWVTAEMNKHIDNEDFVVAFEEAIGTINSDIGRDKDGFQAAILALEIYTQLYNDEKTLIDYLDDIYQEFGYWSGKTLSYKIVSKNWKEEMSEKLRRFEKIKSKDIFGLKIEKVFWNDPAKALEWHLEGGSWIKFRLSGTEPKFKIYFEIYGQSKETCDQTLEAIKNELEIILKSKYYLEEIKLKEKHPYY